MAKAKKAKTATRKGHLRRVPRRVRRSPPASRMRRSWRRMTPSRELADVVGAKPLPRTEVTKKLWAYIKKNGLQDQKNKRMIKADDTLKAVFGGKATVNMFEMTKLVNKHLKVAARTFSTPVTRVVPGGAGPWGPSAVILCRTRCLPDRLSLR